MIVESFMTLCKNAFQALMALNKSKCSTLESVGIILMHVYYRMAYKTRLANILHALDMLYRRVHPHLHYHNIIIIAGN